MATGRKPTAAVSLLREIAGVQPLRPMSGWLLLLVTCVATCGRPAAVTDSRHGRSIIAVPSFCQEFTAFAEDGDACGYYAPPPPAPTQNTIDNVLLAVIKHFNQNNEVFRREMQRANEESWRKFQWGLSDGQ